MIGGVLRRQSSLAPFYLQDLLVDEVEVQLSGRENSRITFTGKLSKLVPGRNELSVFCPVSYPFPLNHD